MNKKTLLGSILFVAIVIALAVVFLLKPDLATIKSFIAGKTPEVAQTGPKKTGVKLYFINTIDPASKTRCDVTKEVTRGVTVSPRMADTTLKALFAGPTKNEKSAGLASPFIPAKGMASTTLSLKSYYLGVSIVDGVATVNFKKDALAYLNSSACLQASVKTPIEQALKQFPSVKEVRYSIEGKVYTEWDA